MDPVTDGANVGSPQGDWRLPHRLTDENFCIIHSGAQEVDMQYTDMFKHAMIQKMSGPDPITATTLSKGQCSAINAFQMAGVGGVGLCYGFPNNAHEYTNELCASPPEKYSAVTLFF